MFENIPSNSHRKLKWYIGEIYLAANKKVESDDRVLRLGSLHRFDWKEKGDSRTTGQLCHENPKVGGECRLLGNDSTLQGANGNDPGTATDRSSLRLFLVKCDDDGEGRNNETILIKNYVSQAFICRNKYLQWQNLWNYYSMHLISRMFPCFYIMCYKIRIIFFHIY